MRALSPRLMALLLVLASALPAQQQGHAGHGAPAALPLTREQIAAVARAQVAISAAHDSSNAKLAKSANKTEQAQQDLQDKFQAQVAGILSAHGLTESLYKQGTFLVSSDTAVRRVFDSLVVAITGAPLPGAVQRGPQLAVPATPAGTHVGHVINAYTDTPNLGQGLLPVAIAEARTAAQHATLAGRMPDNLPYMKTHVDHVLHAVDPTQVPTLMAPGLGYGVKKAATGVVTHIELAATAQGATPTISGHSRHIATSARNVLSRVDQIVALGLKVRAATTAAEAAALVSQIAALADQLIAGQDANGDGRITWEEKEGGLTHAEEHVRLMLRP
jgi:hypothetical protein